MYTNFYMYKSQYIFTKYNKYDINIKGDKMKHIKILTIVSFIFLLSGCIFEKEVTTVIEVEDPLVFLYGEKVNLYEIINITDGFLTDEDYALNTEEIGNKEIIVNYKNSNKKKDKYTLKYEVIDNEEPIIAGSDNIFINRNSDIDILDKYFIGDNADREVECIINGDYDLNMIGTYNLEIVAKDDSNNERTKKINVHVIDGNGITGHTEGTPLSYYVKNYKDDNNTFGIDVSSHQKDIDYQKVKDSGIEFVMIRAGYGPNSEGAMTLDNYFEQNYTKAKEAGLKVGIYLYSYATTLDEVDIQTKWIKDLLKDKQLDLPIAYDWESWKTFRTCNLNFKDLNKLALKFLKNLSDDGYDVMNYGSTYYLTDIWDINNYDTWVAQYNDKVTYENKYIMWQISESTVIDGIEGLVDLDILYK